MNQHNLLILERSSNTLSVESNNGSYVLEGVFGELDKKNRNNRIYTAEEYLPQIESLQEKIKSSKLLGELDHPQKFDISLKSVSHVIEELTYDKESNLIKGRIRLLDTDAGKQAKALVDAGIPLHISSRAAGVVESDGKVKIKQLFTYDLVADPGFENAELKRMNEAYGIDSNDGLLIYEMSQTSDEELLTIETSTQNNNDTIMENKARFVSVEDFNKYSAYLAEEIKSLKGSLAGVSTESIEEKMNALTDYVEYVAERADKGIQYAEYVAETLDNSIEHSNNIAEKLEQSIEYSEHIAESMNNVKDYTNYLAESYNEGATSYENVTKYLNYLKENVESISEYADYIAETINSNLIVEDEAGLPAEDIKADMKEINSEDDKKIIDAADQDVPSDEGAEGAKEVVEGRAFAAAAKKAKDEGKTEFEFDGKTFPVTVKEEVEVSEEEAVKEANGEEAVEEANGEEAGLPAEEIKADMEEVSSEEDKKIIDAADQDVPSEEDAMTEEVEVEIEIEDEKEEEEEAGEEAAEEAVSHLDTYKNEISEKLSALINKATEKKTNDPHFFRFVSESTQTRFNDLSTEDRTKVLSSIEGRGYLTEGQIVTLMEGALVEVANQEVPYFVEAAPVEYKEIWNNLSEAKRNQLTAQSKLVRLTTPYQVRNFWQTRDLREVASVMEKVEMIKESAEVAPKKTSITYDTADIAAQLAARFKK